MVLKLQDVKEKIRRNHVCVENGGEKMGDTGETIIVYGAVFFVLYVVGGIFGCISLPSFDGRFFISGMLFAIFGTGAGTLILRKSL